MARKAKGNPTIKLHVVGTTHDVPLGLHAEGRDCDGRGRYYYWASPTKRVAALVHQIGSETYLWQASGKGADGPRDPHSGNKKTVLQSVAVKALTRAKAAIPKAKGDGELKGAWRGHIECTPSGPEIVLWRDLTRYGRLVVIGKAHRTHRDVKVLVKDKDGKPKLTAKGKKVYRTKKKDGKTVRTSTTSVKWGVAVALTKGVDKPRSKNVGGFSTLTAACAAGYKAMAALVAEVCVPKSMLRSSAQKTAATKKKARTRKTKDAKTGETTTKVVETSAKQERKRKDTTERTRRLVKKPVKVPKSKKNLLNTKIVVTSGKLRGRLAKIVGVKPDKTGSWSNPTLVLTLLTKKEGKVVETKSTKTMLQYTTALAKNKDGSTKKQDGKPVRVKVATFKKGKTVNKGYAAAKKAGVISVTPAAKKAVKKKAAAERKAAAPKKKAAAKKTGEKTSRKRNNPTKGQTALKGAYVSWGPKDKKKHGKIRDVVAGGRGGDDWAKAKLHIDVAERGAGSVLLVVTEEKWKSNEGRKAPGNKNGAWLKARKAATKAAKSGSKAAPKKNAVPKKKAAKKSGLGVTGGGPSAAVVLPGRTSAESKAEAQLAALGF